jgi:hypothetical protein
MMAGDRFGSLLLQGSAPVLVTPAARVGGVNADHGQAAPRCHPNQSIPESTGRYTGHGAAQPLPAFPAAQGLAAGGPCVSEIQVLDHDRRAVVLLGVLKQRGDRRAHPPITL